MSKTYRMVSYVKRNWFNPSEFVFSPRKSTTISAKYTKQMCTFAFLPANLSGNIKKKFETTFWLLRQSLHLRYAWRYAISWNHNNFRYTIIERKHTHAIALQQNNAILENVEIRQKNTTWMFWMRCSWIRNCCTNFFRFSSRIKVFISNCLYNWVISFCSFIKYIIVHSSLTYIQWRSKEDEKWIKNQQQHTRTGWTH